jgi:cytochrome c-type biogenesis protein CcmH/NrfF
LKFNRVYILLMTIWLAVPLPALDEKNIESEYKQIGDKLVCQCGCADQITICSMQNCHSATPMRAELREKLQAGMGMDQIVDSFVTKYGKIVLSAPTTKGFDLAAWVMPFLLLGAGLIVVSWIAVKLTRQAPKPAPAEVPTIKNSTLLERELRDFEEES